MTQDRATPAPAADIDWDADGQPHSRAFDDIYFSRTDGLAETRYVFLAQNRLAQRFAQLGDKTFCIGETGFGSGLNFLATWQLWREMAPAHACLHFVSVEKYPLRHEDLERALALWPELQPLAHELVTNYPLFLKPGFHRLSFDKGRVQLTLILDEAATGLAQLRQSEHPAFRDRGLKFDAWFLDGFAPAKNPDMWSKALFSAIGDLSTEGTTAATFSAAGLVKRGLREAGFEVVKVPGFGRKREMLSASWTGRPQTPSEETARRGTPLPWSVVRDRPALAEKRAMVIGAGLAGCHTARALAERGFEVTLIDWHAGPASEASGNPQALLYAKLSHQDSPLAEFNLASLLYAQRFYAPFLRQSQNFGAASGLIQLATTDKEGGLQQRLWERLGKNQTLVEWVDPEQASTLAGVSLPHSGLYFPNAGWLNPRQICEALIDHPGIHLIESEVENLTRSNDCWRAWDSKGSCVAQNPVTVIANAQNARQFSQTRSSPIKPIRGQVTYVSANDKSRDLKLPLCGDGYIAPSFQGQHCIGASFNLHHHELGLREEDHQTNLNHLAALGLGDWFSSDEPKAGRAAFRCASRDYLPLIGPAPIHERFIADYADLRKDARSPISIAGQYWPGLFINVGHGSRGLAYTPLSAQLVAAHITREPLPLSRDLAQALSPARFVIRDLIRSKI